MKELMAHQHREGQLNGNSLPVNASMSKTREDEAALRHSYQRRESPQRAGGGNIVLKIQRGRYNSNSDIDLEQSNFKETFQVSSILSRNQASIPIMHPSRKNHKARPKKIIDRMKRSEDEKNTLRLPTPENSHIIHDELRPWAKHSREKQSAVTLTEVSLLEKQDK